MKKKTTISLLLHNQNLKVELLFSVIVHSNDYVLT